MVCSLVGWDDGKIRAFTPQSGKLLYTVHDGHSKGVTAIATSSDSKRIISGGGEGQVRVWDIYPHTQVLKEAMKEHKGIRYDHTYDSTRFSFRHQYEAMLGQFTCVQI